jgi:hypothetical protein
VDKTKDRTAEYEARGIMAGLEAVSESDKIQMNRELHTLKRRHMDLTFQTLATKLDQSKQMFAVEMNKAQMASQIMQYDLERAKVANSAERMESLAQQLALEDRQKTLEAKQKLRATQVIQAFDQQVAGEVYEAMSSGNMEMLADVYKRARANLGPDYHYISQSKYAPERMMAMLNQQENDRLTLWMKKNAIDRELWQEQLRRKNILLQEEMEGISEEAAKRRALHIKTGGVPPKEWGFRKFIPEKEDVYVVDWPVKWGKHKAFLREERIQGDAPQKFKKGLTAWLQKEVRQGRYSDEKKALFMYMQDYVNQIELKRPRTLKERAKRYWGRPFRKLGDVGDVLGRAYADPNRTAAWQAVHTLTDLAHMISTGDELESQAAQNELVQFLDELRGLTPEDIQREREREKYNKLLRQRQRLERELEQFQPPTRRYESVRTIRREGGFAQPQPGPQQAPQPGQPAAVRTVPAPPTATNREVPSSQQQFNSAEEARAAGFGVGDMVYIKGVGLVRLDF